MSVQSILDSLFADLEPSRITLRQPSSDDVFPITHEVVGPGVASIRGVVSPNMAGQPVVKLVLAGEQVVQNDCTRVFTDDAAFQAVLGLYGGMKAQIVTPVIRDGETVAIISVHQLGLTRAWTEEEAARCRQAAADVLKQLPGA